MPRTSTVKYSDFIQEIWDKYSGNSELKDTSKKQTKTALNKISNANRDNFIEMTVEVAGELIQQNTSTAHNFISSVKSVITHNGIKLASSENKLIDDTFLKIKLIKEKESNDPTATKKQNERFFNLEELKKIFFEKQDTLGDDEILAYSLYILMPPVRNDYTTMEVTNSNVFQKDNVNYYHYRLKQFIFNEYKTATSEPLIVKPPEELIEVIEKSLERMPRKNLIYKIGSNTVSTNTFGKMIQSVSEKLVGIPIGINDIRHLYASQHNVSNTDLDILKEDARIMGHSLKVHSQIYTKMYDKMYDEFQNELGITTDVSEIDPKFVKTVKKNIQKTKKAINEMI